MNGSSHTAGLEPAVTSEPDHYSRWAESQLAILKEAACIFEREYEHKAAEEAWDAVGRIRQRIIEEIAARKAREGQRRSEGVHGQDPPEAEVNA